MRSVATVLLLVLSVVVGITPTRAQASEPGASPEPAGSEEPAVAHGSTVLCLRVTAPVPPGEVDAITLGQLLLDGEATLEAVEPGDCGADDVRPSPTPGVTPTPGAMPTPPPTLEPTATPRPGREATREPGPRAYVRFVSHAAGAAVELAALAERSGDIDGLDELDRAARDLRRWARRQVKWLDRHPPAACYASVHRQWRRGVVRIRDGAGDVREAIRTLRPEPIRRAVRQLSAGVGDLRAVDLDRVTRACITADERDGGLP